MRLILSILLAVVLTACATPELDTSAKRAYATELAVQQMLEQVDQYRCDRERRAAGEPGCFTPEQWADVFPRLRQLSIAYQGFQAARDQGESLGANIATVNQALRALRPYVLEATHESE